jgi:hypothetical protein
MEDLRKTWSTAALAVGTIVLGYAELENSLYLISSIVFYKAGGRDYKKHGGRRPEWRHFPENAKERHDMLDACFANLAPLSSFRDTWHEIREGIAQVDTKRHAMVHGTWSGEIGPEVSLTFVRFKVKKNKHQRLTLRLRHSQMVSIAKRIHALNSVAAELAECLYHLLVPKDERHEPLGGR